MIGRGDKLGPMRVRVLAMLTAGLVFGLAGLAACGPIAYVSDVTVNADNAVEAARAAQAEKLAPYWWTRATEYLHKARENAARADFQGANRFGRLAQEAAEQAIADAKDPSKRPIDLGKEPGAGGVAPAKGDGGAIAPAKDEP